MQRVQLHSVRAFGVFRMQARLNPGPRLPKVSRAGAQLANREAAENNHI
jgi:hypothetical protein